MMKPDIKAGSGLATALAQHSSATAHTMLANSEMLGRNINHIFDRMERNRALKAQEEQRKLDNAYRDNAFSEQKAANERSYNYQKERDLAKDNQWQQEMGLRQQELGLKSQQVAQGWASANLHQQQANQLRLGMEGAAELSKDAQNFISANAPQSQSKEEADKARMQAQSTQTTPQQPALQSYLSAQYAISQRNTQAQEKQDSALNRIPFFAISSVKAQKPEITMQSNIPKEAELAEVEAEIAKLEAQKGIKTSQTSQPQSAQSNLEVSTGTTPQGNYLSAQYAISQRNAQAPQEKQEQVNYLSRQWEIKNTPQTTQEAQNTQNAQKREVALTGYPRIDYKLIKGIQLNTQDIHLLRQAGHNDTYINKVQGDINVRKTNMNTLTKEMTELSELYRASEVVLSMLREESNLDGAIDRFAQNVSRGIWETDAQEAEWQKEAETLLNGMTRLRYGNQIDSAKRKEAENQFGFAKRAYSVKHNAGVMKGVLKEIINRGELLLQKSDMSGVNVKDAKNFMNRLELAKEHLGYLNGLNKDFSNYKDSDIKRYKED